MKRRHAYSYWTALLGAWTFCCLFPILSSPALADSTSGSIIIWGDNTYGQTNVPPTLTGVTAISQGDNFCLALKNDGTVVAWGYNVDGRTDVPAGLSNVTAISAGGCCLALKSDGTVVAWGYNANGQTNVPAGLSGVVAISAGEEHSLALKSDGTVVAWGRSNEGQTSVPFGLSGVVAIAATQWHSLALKSNGTVVAWGLYAGYNPVCFVPNGLTNVIAISAAAYSSMALKSDGTVVMWGDNGFGQLGVPAGLSNVVAIAAASHHSVALKSDGTVVAWGVDAYGQTDVPASAFGPAAISARCLNTMVLQPYGPAPANGPMLVGGRLGTSYSQALQATGGVAPYSWKIVSGQLPAGLVLDGSGILHGTPSALGLAWFRVRVTGADGLSTDKDLVMAIGEPPTITASSPLPSGAVNVPYNVALSASGGATPYLWSVTSGSLPPGLNLSRAGVISGVPESATDTSFTVQVTSAQGIPSTAVVLRLVVEPPPPPVTNVVNGITVSSPGTNVVGAYSGFSGLIVTNAGVLVSDAGVIGASGYASNNVALVSGTGSLWSNAGSLTVGSTGAYNRLTVNAGGAVLNTVGFVGYNSNSVGNAVVVTGAGSAWSNSSSVFVGYVGSGNSLTIADGGQVSDADITLGYDALSSNNTVLITGAGSSISNAANFFVGYAGSSNILTVANGAVMSSPGGFVGVYSPASNNALQVTGAGSAWNTPGSLMLGYYAGNNSLSVSAGGQVADAAGYVGFDGGGNAALVTDPGSVWSNNCLQIGYDSGGNTLTIRNGGLVWDSTGYLGSYGPGGNSALVSGPGSAWIGSDSLSIGYACSGNSLLITNGGVVSAPHIYMGSFYGYGGNSITLSGGFLVATNSDGTGALDVNAGAFNLNSGTATVNQLIARSGSGSPLNLNGGTLNVTSGATVNGRPLVVGDTGSGATVNLAGGVSTLDSGALVGNAGSLNTLAVSNGAWVSSLGTAALGSEAFSTGNTLLVTGAGTVWSNSASLYVGGGGSFNQLVINDGGGVLGSNGFLGGSSGSSQNLARVSGAGSVWSNSDSVYVGSYGSFNRLIIDNGGRVSDSRGYVGGTATASNNSALVTDGGSVWMNSGNLTIGANASGNSLTVSRGAQAVAGGAILVGSGSNATANTLLVANTGSVSGVGLVLGASGGQGNSVTLTGNSTGNLGGGMLVWGVGAGSSGNQLTLDSSSSLTNIGGLLLGDNNTTFYMTNSAAGFVLNGLTTNQLQFNNGFGPLTIGFGGVGTALVVSNYSFRSTGLVLGDAGGQGNRVTLTGNSTGNLGGGALVWGVGAGASGNQLTIAAGSSLTNIGGLLLGDNATTFYMTNSAAGLVLNNLTTNQLQFANGFVPLTVGFGGTGTVLVISNYSFKAAGLVLGDAGGQGNRVALTGNSAGNLGGGVLVWGYGAGASGNQLTIDANSSLTNIGGLILGDSGATFYMTNSAAGLVFNDLTTNQLQFAGGFGLLAIGGDGSTGTTLVIRDYTLNSTGTVNVYNGALALDSGAAVTVNQFLATNGANSQVSLNGSTLNSHSVLINNGSALTVGDAVGGSALNLAGGVSLFNNGLVVGNSGAANSLSIAGNAGVLVNGSTVVGNVDGSTHNTVLVTGSNTFWVNGGNLVVGETGAFNQLTVSGGATIVATNIILGDAAASSGNSVTVFGGSLATFGSYHGAATGSVESVGGGGGGGGGDGSGGTGSDPVGFSSGTLMITNSVLPSTSGAILQMGTISAGATLGYGLVNIPVCSGGVTYRGSPVVMISGGGVTGSTASTLSSPPPDDKLYVGKDGSSNSLTIGGGGSVADYQGFVGYGSNANANSVLVTGAGSVWTNTDLYVGYGGSFNQVTITNGGRVFLAEQPTSSTFVGAIIIDPGSYQVQVVNFNPGQLGLVNVSIDPGGQIVFVGNSAQYILGNSLTTTLDIGYGANSNSMLVSGIGSVCSNQYNMVLGAGGNGNALTIADGGQMFDASAALGGGSGNAVTVTGAGSFWSNSGSLYVGQGGVGNSVTIAGGGQVFNSSATVGDGTGNAVTVTGVGSFWNNSGSLSIGWGGVGNNLTIANGGVVASALAVIGSPATSSGLIPILVGSSPTTFATSNSVLVTGAGSVWSNSGSLVVGNATTGGGNGLTIASNGTVTVSSVQVGTGTGVFDYVTVSGGNLIVTDPSNGTLNVSHGLVTLNSGTVAVNRMTLTNLVSSGATLGLTRVAQGTILFQGTNSGGATLGLTRVGQGTILLQGTNSFTSSLSVLVLSNGTFSGLLVGSNVVLVQGTNLLAHSSNANSIVTTESGSGGGSGAGSEGDVGSGSMFMVSGGNLYSSNGYLYLVGGTTVTPTSFMTFNGGTLVSGGSAVNNGLVYQVGDGTDAATFQLVGGTHSFANGLFINTNAVLTGTGVIAGSILDAGILSPGTAIGTWTDTGSVTLLSGSTTLMDLAGTNSWLYDQLDLTGTMTFGGTLTVSLLDGYTPLAGDSFNLFGFGSANGAFSQINLPTLAAGCSWDISQLYSVGRISAGVNITTSTNVVVVSGTTTNTAGTCIIGNTSGGGTLILTNGATLLSSGGILGGTLGANSNALLVTGVGSIWSNSGSLYLGLAGCGNTLTLSNGGSVFSSNIFIGATTTATGNILTVSGGLLNATNPAGSGVISIAGGALHLNSGTVAVDQLLLTNTIAGLVTVNGGVLQVGQIVSSQPLTVNGGTLTLSSSFLNATGGTFQLNNGTVIVPATMANLGLFVQNGGFFDPLVFTNSGSFVLNSGTNMEGTFLNLAGATVLQTGGELDVNAATNAGTWTLTGGTANLTNVNDLGTLVLSSGVMNVSALVVTNAGSVFTFNGGTINSGGSTVNNGSIFQVGDGVRTATLALLGGSHSFANGLLINTNVTLTGTGAITGSITDDGIIAPGNGLGVITDVGDLTLLTSGAVSMELGGTNTALYDQLDLTGSLAFGGTLNVALVNGYTVQAGDWFNLFDFGSGSGSFNTLNLPTLAASLYWNTNALYTTGVLEADAATGSVQVALGPQAAVDAGARWQIDSDGNWHTNNATVSGVTAGSHTLSYTNLTGWIAPGNQTIQVTQGTLTTTSGTYQLTPVLLAAVSRKTHGSAGTFNLNLNLNGSPTATVEPRTGGPTQLVFTFNKPMTAADGTLDATEFTLTNATFSSVSISGSNLTLTLSGVVDQSRVTVVMTGLADLAGNALSGTNAVIVRALYGDENQSGTVNVIDLQQAKNNLAAAVTAANFLSDINCSGTINVIDLQQMKNSLTHTANGLVDGGGSGGSGGASTSSLLVTGADTSSATNTVVGLALGTALGATNLVWSTGGDAAWTVTTAEDGTEVVWSGKIGDLNVSWMETTVTGAGTVSFEWMVSSDAGGDILSFAMDGVVQTGAISGEMGWQTVTYSVPAGTHRLTWTYGKNGSVSSGLDAGWVRRMTYSAP